MEIALALMVLGTVTLLFLLAARWTLRVCFPRKTPI
jgi:hypothetical protein